MSQYYILFTDPAGDYVIWTNDIKVTTRPKAPNCTWVQAPIEYNPLTDIIAYNFTSSEFTITPKPPPPIR